MERDVVRRMLGLPDLLEVKSVLAVEPHPDDNEVGAGATVKLLTSGGVRVVYLTVTDGRAGSEKPGMTAETMISTRRSERQDASRILGVEECYNLGFEDGGNWSEHHLMSVLVPLIRQFRPELLMTVDPWTPYESHPDHIKTGKAAAAALISAKSSIAFKGQGDPYDVPQVAFYGTAYPNTFVDVTATWEAKLAALRAHVSQFQHDPRSDLYLQFLTAEAERLYREHNAAEPGRIEAFKVLAQLQLHFFPDAVRS